MSRRKRTAAVDPGAFADRYPHIARWVQSGVVEIGWLGFGTPSFIRALDEGGMVWEGTAAYSSLDDAFAALDAGIATFMAKHGIT
jgi:hypothetical protein